MARKTRLSVRAVNVQARALGELCNGGFIDLMTGEQPDEADDEQVEELRLVRCQLANNAFGPPRDGVLTANPISKAIAMRTGKPTWFRLRTRDGEAVLDGSAGKSGDGRAGEAKDEQFNGLINVTRVEEGQVVNITSFTHKVQK